MITEGTCDVDLRIQWHFYPDPVIKWITEVSCIQHKMLKLSAIPSSVVSPSKFGGFSTFTTSFRGCADLTDLAGVVVFKITRFGIQSGELIWRGQYSIDFIKTRHTCAKNRFLLTALLLEPFALSFKRFSSIKKKVFGTCMPSFDKIRQKLTSPEQLSFFCHFSVLKLI